MPVPAGFPGWRGRVRPATSPPSRPARRSRGLAHASVPPIRAVCPSDPGDGPRLLGRPRGRPQAGGRSEGPRQLRQAGDAGPPAQVPGLPPAGQGATGSSILTSFEALKAGGEIGPGVRARQARAKASSSRTSPGTKPLMPPTGPPHDRRGGRHRSTRWVAQGAKDDTPPQAKDSIDADHPPGLRRRPAHHRPGLRPRRPNARRLGLSRSPDPQGGRLGAGQAAGRAGAADRGADVLARRHDPRGRSAARPAGSARSSSGTRRPTSPAVGDPLDL